MFTKISDMEPLFPTTDAAGRLDELAIEVIRKSAPLAKALHPITASSVRELLRLMNSYYSNLIEGHATSPIEIEKALSGKYSKDPAKRALQIEAKAHIEVQRLMEKRLGTELELSIWDWDFLSWIHKEFYTRLPEEFRNVENVEGGQKQIVLPGGLRLGEVKVGAHIAPLAEHLPSFLKKYAEVYSAPMNDVRKLIAVAASHHRLVWIHPFLDGNGRVTRLFSESFLIKANLAGHGLWAISRGLARSKGNYLSALTWADASRQNDLDGRGNLSDSGLIRFCTYFLETCLDQICFMNNLLELDGFQNRISAYVERRAYLKELKPESIHLLREAFLRGEFARGEASRITGLPERTARDVLGKLLTEGLLISSSPKSPVRLHFPASVVGYYFPRLYPEAVEFTL